MIKNVEIKNFRCLKDFSISLEEDITVIVGENDTGKTSFIDTLKFIFEDNKGLPEIDDFYNGTDEIIIKIDFDGKSFLKKFTKDDSDNVKPEIFIEFPESYILNIENELNSPSFESLDEEVKKGKLSEVAKELGVNISRISRLDTLTERVENKIEELKENDYNCPVDSIPDYNIYFLGGTDFEDINSFFERTFFKDIKRDIWYEKTDDGVTIENLVLSKLDEHTEGLIKDIEEKGIKTKLKQYLPELTDIKVDSDFNPNNININVKVQLLEDGTVIPVKKKGDGTKRRITMALLEYQSDQTEKSIHIFDEPDTHLHVKAQFEFLDILRNFNKLERQVILTTHSPFIMNSVKSEKIRFLFLDNQESKLKTIVDDEELEWTLNNLGIANTHLFFSRNVLIVEGYTEEDFINLLYPRLYGISLHSNLIKIIRGDGIEDASRLSKILEDFIGVNNIYLLIDNDGDSKLLEIIDTLKIPDDNIFKIGHKEFEDSFDSKIIYESWKEFIEAKYDAEKLETFEAEWTEAKIESLKDDCIKNDKKFSEELVCFSRDMCFVPMEKPKLGYALARKVGMDDLDNNLINLFSKINEVN